MGGKTAGLASLVLALAGLGAIGSGGAAQAAAAPVRCDVGKFADLPVTMAGMRPQVTLKINGSDTTFTVDSGAFFSFINQGAVKRMNLPTKMAPFGYEVRGVGGSENRVDVATVKQFGLGHLDIPDVVFLSVPNAGGESAGLIGQNVLSLFDTEYDLGAGVLRLMKPSDGCAHANLAYWAEPNAVSMIEVESISPQQRHLRGTALINGQKVKVVFDTGASSSVLKRSSAERLGFRVDGPGVQARGAARGIGPKAVETWTAPFDSFEIGNERIEHTRLQVGDIDALGADMLLGIDFFLSHRIYVSKQQHRIFFTYSGGPVFRLEAGAHTQFAGEATKTVEGRGDVPTDAAGFARRGSAAMARRDYPAAIADFSKAAELEPADPQHVVDRGEAHLFSGESALAMADFDQALKLRPGFAPALVGRGRLYMISRDTARGHADLDAAVKADPDTALSAAAIFINNQQFEPGIADLDLWIAGHPDSRDLAFATSQRCRARTLWNRDLDKALADCDAAIRHGPTTAVMFEARGLAHLRRGEADAALADFNRALKEQPKLAWALYGRSIIERSKGEAAPAEADLTAAKAIAPRLPDAGRRYGFEGAPEKSAG